MRQAEKSASSRPSTHIWAARERANHTAALPYAFEASIMSWQPGMNSGPAGPPSTLEVMRRQKEPAAVISNFVCDCRHHSSCLRSTAQAVVCMPDGNLCISNTGSHRLVFVSPETGDLLATFGDADNQFGAFRGPRGLACDGTSLFVADCYNCVIKKFNVSDHRLTGIAGQYGERDGELRYPNGLALKDGTLYVADSSNGRIVAYEASTMHFLFSFPLNRGPPRSKDVMKMLAQAGFVASSTAPRSHLRPGGLAILGDELFATDAYNRRIQVFSMDGTFRRFLTPMSNEGTNRGSTLLVLPESLATASGRLFVSDKRGDSVHVIDCNNGASMQILPFLVQKPHALAGVATDGLRVYIIDEARSEIQVMINFYAEAGKKTANEQSSTPGQIASKGTPRTPRRPLGTTPRKPPPSIGIPPIKPAPPTPDPALVKAAAAKKAELVYKRSQLQPSIKPTGDFRSPSAAMLRARDPDSALAVKTRRELNTPRSDKSFGTVVSSQAWTPRGSTPLGINRAFGLGERPKTSRPRLSASNKLKLEVVV